MWDAAPARSAKAILDRCAPAAVLGVDPSEGFLAHARRQVQDPRAEFRAGDARALPVEDAAFDAVASGLVLNFVPDQPKAAAEMRRAVRPGGTVAAYVWDYADGMEIDAPLLGRGGLAGPRRARAGRGPALSALPARAAARTL